MDSLGQRNNKLERSSSIRTSRRWTSLCLNLIIIRKEYLRLGLYSPIESVEGRVKSAASIIEKVSRKGISRNRIEDEVEDIAGIRLICQFVEDIPKIIDIIRQRDGHDIKIVEERDYIANKKESGIQKLSHNSKIRA